MGEDCGELLAFDDRSDEEELIDWISSSVSKSGQNSKSSSKSNDRPASNLARKAARGGVLREERFTEASVLCC